MQIDKLFSIIQHSRESQKVKEIFLKLKYLWHSNSRHAHTNKVIKKSKDFKRRQMIPAGEMSGTFMGITRLTFTKQMTLSSESMWAQTLEWSWKVDTFGVDAASVGTAAFIYVKTLLIGQPCVACWTLAFKATRCVHTFSIPSTRASTIGFLTFINVC